VTLSVARKLKVPDLMLVVNKTPPAFDPEEVRQRVEKAYDCEVTAVLPHSDELMAMSSAGIFALRYPDHPVTGLLRQIAARLTA
jgi:septum site-determining protein MinD